MNKKLRALLERKQKAISSAKSITMAAESESRDLSDEERGQFDTFAAQIESLNGDIEREKALLAAEQSLAGVDLNSTITGGEPAAAADPRRGFRTFGDFAVAVRRAGGHGAQIDERLAMQAAAPSTYGSEGVGADGGYAVPPEFSREIFRHALQEDAILPLTDGTPISGNSMAFPKDETTPWGSDGMRAYWEAEAAAANATKPKLGLSQLRLHKLFGLVPLTDELLADAAAMEAYVFNALAESIRWKSNDAFFHGSGAGQPLGFMNSPAKVAVAKEGAQAGGTVVVQNVAKMFARSPNASRAVWMVNNDVLPQLITMTLNNYPIYIPPGGLPNAPAGLLLGRPLVVSQHCKSVGAEGDIAFVDWKMYRTITKAAGIETATSMHLYFDAGATAFRSIFRIDGQPKITAPIVPANGSNNLSPYVTLAVRS